MKNKKPRVLVSHPGKQHVHQLCYALQQQGMLQHFITSLWYKPGNPFFRAVSALPSGVRSKVEKVFKKKYFAPLQEEKITMIPLAESVRQVVNLILDAHGEEWVYPVERFHDRSVAGRLAAYNPDIVIGYEKSSLETFRKAKSMGKITVLDLAQVHYSHIMELRRDYRDMAEIVKDEKLYAKINQTKAAEYQYTDYVITLSGYARQTLIDAGIPGEKVITLNLGFDPSLFTPKPAYRRTGPFNMLFVGQISKRKGLRVLLETFKELNLPDATLTFVGSMADGKAILDKYEGLFTHVPYLLHADLVKYYQQADLFVFPSYLDSWALTVLESMACGTPVVVTEHTGSRDAVRQGGGFIIPVDDKEALKERILFFYQNREQLEVVGRKAHEVAQAYTWSNYYGQVQKAMMQIWEQQTDAVPLPAAH
jgi:glycosyltransferase involved in cell wall biosynthesis